MKDTLDIIYEQMNKKGGESNRDYKFECSHNLMIL